MVATHSQETCARNLHKFLASNFRASSADDTSNKNGRSGTKQITFSTLSVDHSMGTQNFYLNNLNKFKKTNQMTHYIKFVQQIVNNIKQQNENTAAIGSRPIRAHHSSHKHIQVSCMA